MTATLRFVGATGNVTGSRYLLETDHVKLLVDCGLYQERKFQHRNWDPFVVPPRELDAVLLTHAHLDHCGLLPKLVKEGFKGKIYCTGATADITKIILKDSAHLQEEDAARKKRRHEREGRKGPHPEVPLYTAEDAEATSPFFSPVDYMEPVQIGKGVSATFREAGHVLGSAIIKITIDDNGSPRSIVFTGDVGRNDRPILEDPDTVRHTDYVVIESTYGDRVHEDTAAISGEIAEVVNSTVQAGGNIVVPSFALERSQEILYYMNELTHQNKIPHLNVYLDSPMAIAITEVFKHYEELYDEEMTELVNHRKSPFNFPGFKMVQTTDESKSLNAITGSIMVIAGSGMCTGGRIKHHLINNITRPESTILFVGYQAVGTLGRIIVDGARKVRIFGQQYPVRARIAQIHGFSAHADRDELCAWLAALKSPPRKVFVTHGEAQASANFAECVRERTGWKVSVPRYGQQVLLR